MTRFLLLRRLSLLLTAALLVVSVAQAGPPPIPLAAVPCTTEPNINRSGQDYASLDVPPNPSVCRVACENDPQCRAYTYVRPGVQGPGAKCWLKNGVPPAQPDGNCVSGVKQLGPPPPGPSPTPAPYQPAAPAGEDCIAFDSSAVSAAQIGGRWKVVQGNMSLLDFGNSEPQARQALQVIQHYGMNSQCFVGRPMRRCNTTWSTGRRRAARCPARTASPSTRRSFGCSASAAPGRSSRAVTGCSISARARRTRSWPTTPS